jgi:hypothetical protein
MKTKEEMQAALNDIRRICESHGVVLVAGRDTIGEPSILFETPGNYPDNKYRFYETPHCKPEEFLITNTIKEDQARFVAKGIGDIEGLTKPLIIVHQHLEGFSEMNVANTVCADSLDEVEEIQFVKHWKEQPTFSHFECGVGDGPFGTLVAYGKNGDVIVPMSVVAFVEGVKPEELVKKWPTTKKAAAEKRDHWCSTFDIAEQQAREANNGNL